MDFHEIISAMDFMDCEWKFFLKKHQDGRKQ